MLCSYLNLLRERETVPKIRPGSKPSLPERLIILPGEDNVGSTSAGRPVGPEYSSLQERIAFMDKHAIDLSVRPSTARSLFPPFRRSA